MTPTTLQGYVYLGTAIRYLQDVDETVKIEGDGYLSYNIRSVLENIDALELTVSKQGSWYLSNFLTNIAEYTSAEGTLTKQGVTDLTRIMSNLRHTLESETGTKFVYTVTDKRLDSKKLLNNVPALLAVGSFEQMPDIAQFDFVESGICIAFERPTAAAFHLLRGTEAVLRQLYLSVVKAKRLPSKSRMWGPMVEKLRTRTAGRPSDTLLQTLDNIRASYRNPTFHPETCYSIDAVQDLFSLCADAVQKMVSHPKYDREAD